jgi:hypothetical protein
VVGLFLTLELISNLAVEPWLYGRGIGVSETATLVMVAFWTWLWGPIGLILATPLTVCLVVLGKYVPHLGFFDTLLGDRPALETHVGYYQRLLARDQDEAADIAAQHLKGNSLAATFDSLLIPALVYAKHDLERDVLSKEDQRFVVDATRDAVEELVTLDERTHQADERTQEAAAESARALVRILGCPARDDSDQVALLMLKQLLDPKCYDLSLTTTALLSSEVITHVGDARPAVVCIAALPPGGVAQTRLLCLRLHARFPDMKILIGRWGATDSMEKTREQLLAAGADQIATTLEDTCDRLAALRPILASHESWTDAQGEEAAPLLLQ